MLTTLPPTEEQALRLVELNGHTQASSSALANVPESTIWSRVRIGRQRLRNLATARDLAVTASPRLATTIFR